MEDITFRALRIPCELDHHRRGWGPRWLDRTTSYSLVACYSMIGRAIRILLYHLKELDFYTFDFGIAHILEEYIATEW